MSNRISPEEKVQLESAVRSFVATSVPLTATEAWALATDTTKRDMSVRTVKRFLSSIGMKYRRADSGYLLLDPDAQMRLKMRNAQKLAVLVKSHKIKYALSVWWN